MAEKKLTREQREKAYKAQRQSHYNKTVRDHETNLAVINLMANDPEMKYFLGMASGYGIASIGAFLEGLKSHKEVQSGDQDKLSAIWATLQTVSPAAASIGVVSGSSTIGKSWWNVAQLGSPLAIFGGKIFGGSESVSGVGLGDNMGSILKFTGLGFSGTCTAILLLKAVFSGTDLGELLSGVGEIIPG